MSYVKDFKENGLKNIKKRIVDSFNGIVSSFKSPENFKLMVKSIKERIKNFSLDKVSNKIHNYLTRLNDYLYGINQFKKDKNTINNGESKYWKQLTGMSKA